MKASSGAFSASIQPQSVAATGSLSGSRATIGSGAGKRRGAQSSETPFPMDIPVIGWTPKGPQTRLSTEELEQKMEQHRLKTLIRHEGWLFKRAQVTLDSKRWYVLENSRLFTFMRENYLSQDDSNMDANCWQFPGCIRSIIDLEGASINVISKQKLLLEIQCDERCSWSKKGNLFSDLGSGVSGSAKHFTFYAEDDTSFQSWVDALSRVEAYKKLKLQWPSMAQPHPHPLTLWDLPRESLLRIFCRMQDDKSDFKFFEKKWLALREEDVMYYRRVVLLLNGSHQRAIDRHKQVALQEWEVNNSWKEVYEHITLNKLTSEPVIEVEYPRLEIKLPLENCTVVMKVKERMEIFADYKALPRILCQFLKVMKELKIEQLSSDEQIEQWMSSIEPFVEKFTPSKPLPNSRSKKTPPPTQVKPSEEEVEFAKSHAARAVEIVDGLLAKLGSALLLEDGPVVERKLFDKLYNSVIAPLIEAQQLAGMMGEPGFEDAAREVTQDIDSEAFASVHARQSDAAQVDEIDDDGNIIKVPGKALEKDVPHAPELFADWEGGAEEVDTLSYVTFLVKMHEIASVLLKSEVVMQSYYDRVTEVLLDKSSDEVKGFRPSTMKKEEHVQHLPVNGHIQTVAYRSLKSKNGQAPQPDNVVKKVFSFITVGSFSAHALKFKHGKGYEGFFLKLSEQAQALDSHLAKLYTDSEILLRALVGDESAAVALLVDETFDESTNAGIAGNATARLKKKLDKVVSCIWKIFSPGTKGDVSIPAILKAREGCEKRRSMSISQALASFAEVIMCQFKTFYHGSSPDFWHILDIIGAFTITVSCLVSVYEAEMGMVDDTYSACRWVIDRRLMIRLKLMTSSMHTEQDSDFFWTLCEDADGAGAKSRQREGDAAAPYKVLFRNFPCEKEEGSSGPCSCRVCRSHPLPSWAERVDEENLPKHYHDYRAKSSPSDFVQPVLVIHIRKKYWDKIPEFVLDPSDPTHLRFDYPLFPIFNNVGINETQLMAAKFSPQNFLVQNRVNMDAAAVFMNIHAAVEHNVKALSPKHTPSVAAHDTAASSSPQSPSEGSPSAHPTPPPLLIFKKLRPPPKSAAGRAPSARVDCMEEPPTLDDDLVAEAARWPSKFNDVDAQQVLNRLKAQILDACTKCRDACLETRKAVKEVAKKKLQKQASQRRHLGGLEDIAAEDSVEASASVTAQAAVTSASVVPSSALAGAVSPSGFVDTHSQLETPPIEQLEVIGDVSRSKLASGRIVMCKSAKDRTSMYVTYEEEEHDPANANSTKKEFMELVQRMCVDCIPSLLLHVDAFCFALSLEARYRGCVAVDTYCRRTDGTRIHNVRKNVHTSTYAFNRVQGAILPVNYRPPASRMAWGVQS